MGLLPGSSAVEHPTVNRTAACSNQARGAILRIPAGTKRPGCVHPGRSGEACSSAKKDRPAEAPTPVSGASSRCHLPPCHRGTDSLTHEARKRTQGILEVPPVLARLAISLALAAAGSDPAPVV